MTTFFIKGSLKKKEETQMANIRSPVENNEKRSRDLTRISTNTRNTYQHMNLVAYIKGILDNYT